MVNVYPPAPTGSAQGTQQPGVQEFGRPTQWRRERYRDGAFSHELDTEWERLQLLESVLDHHTISHLRALGVGPGTRCLEIGGGAGSVARWMAEQGARTTVTDLDTRFVDGLAADGVEVLRHDAYVDDFPAGSFDVIHCRYVLVHLPDQEKVISRIASWLAPHGVLVVEEPAFFPIENAPHPAYRKVMLAFRRHLERVVGTDTAWARALPVPLESGGLVDVGFDARLQLIAGGDAEAEWWRLTLEQTRAAIVAEGNVQDRDFDEAYAELRSPAFHDVSLAVFTAWGRRPGQ